VAKPKTTKKRRKPPAAQPAANYRRAYQTGYYHGLQTMAAIIRDACDLRDVPAAERLATDYVRDRILASISTAMHDIQACGRATLRH